LGGTDPVGRIGGPYGEPRFATEPAALLHDGYRSSLLQDQQGHKLTSRSRIIQFWGFCDLLLIAWWISTNLIRGDVPIYDDIRSALRTSSSFGLPIPIVLTFVALALYVSIIYSGILLLQLNPKGAIVCYFQLPLRIVTLTPSLFFAIWPIKHFFTSHNEIIISGITIIFVSETAKLASVIPWHMKLRENLVAGGSI